MSTHTSVRTQRRRAAFASGIGTTIEFYDFLIYSTAAAIVFPRVFFPALGGVAATVASLSTFAVAFLARPLGAVIFGHYGDRIGRKRTLTITLVMMGLGTMLVGVIPPAGTIGVLAPIILIVLRIVQGVALGGEWAGAALLAAEYAPPKKRGLYGIFPQLGSPLGYGLSSLVFLVTILLIGQGEQFFGFGWRIPFLLSGILIVIGLYLRMRIEETPVFQAALDRRETQASATKPQAPLISVFRTQSKAILVGTTTQLPVFALFYVCVTYVLGHATTPVAQGGMGLTKSGALSMDLIGAAFFAAGSIISGLASDRVGRRRFARIAMTLCAIWSVLLFPVLNNGTLLAFGIAMSVSLLVTGLQNGYIAALVPELFHTEHRYTGSAVAYNLAAVLGGAVTPLIAAPLAASFGTGSVGMVLLGIALIGLVCSLGLPRVAPTELHAIAGSVRHTVTESPTAS